jgi:hypothetical protein
MRRAPWKIPNEVEERKGEGMLQALSLSVSEGDKIMISFMKRDLSHC